MQIEKSYTMNSLLRRTLESHMKRRTIWLSWDYATGVGYLRLLSVHDIQSPTGSRIIQIFNFSWISSQTQSKGWKSVFQYPCTLWGIIACSTTRTLQAFFILIVSPLRWEAVRTLLGRSSKQTRTLLRVQQRSNSLNVWVIKSHTVVTRAIRRSDKGVICL